MIPLPSDRRYDLLPLLIAAVVFSVCSLWGAINSEGFLETDAITHYLYARYAISEPHYFVNIWGRPLCTGVYALPAYLFGRMGVRVTSLLLALICSLVTYQIARGQKYRWPALGMVFVLAQPLVFLHSFSELTELPFATLIAFAFLAYQRRQFLLMALLIGLSPLGRPEGFGFILIALVGLVVHRRWWWIPLLFLPLLVWDYCGWRVYGSPRYGGVAPDWLQWLPRNWPYSGESLYERGWLMKYLACLPAIVSPLVFPAMVVGLVVSFRALRRGTVSVNEALIAVLPLLILATHSLLHWRGKMASSGELRYLLVVAPFWALLSARGWEWIWLHMRWKRPLAWAAVFALAPALINCRQSFGGFTLGYKVLPLELHQDMLDARIIANWYRTWEHRNDYPRIMVAHPGVFYFLDESPTRHAIEWTRESVRSVPSGTVIVWDEVYSVFNSDEKRVVQVYEIERAGWRLHWSTNWLIGLSPRDASGRPTTVEPKLPLR